MCSAIAFRVEALDRVRVPDASWVERNDVELALQPCSQSQPESRLDEARHPRDARTAEVDEDRTDLRRRMDRVAGQYDEGLRARGIVIIEWDLCCSADGTVGRAWVPVQHRHRWRRSVRRHGECQ
jgi:hypothetical protein